MTPLIERLRTRGYFADIDCELARALSRVGGESDPDVLVGVALASRQVREGHVCAELPLLAGRSILDPAGTPIEEAQFPELSRWQKALGASPLTSDGSGFAPLVLDHRARLYLARYYAHETALAERLVARALPAKIEADESALRSTLGRLFGPRPESLDWQRVAAMVAVLMRTLILTGGPGTGKTTTVVKLLALLVEHAPAPPRTLLLAPTGKAAARLSEAVAGAKAKLSLSDTLKSAIVEEASTIHRALGPMGGDGTRFRHDREHPLAADIVVVDESSMVDVALMRRLLDAVPDSARLILLGDAHQLVSVEAGAVLGDICSGLGRFGPSAELAERAFDAFGEPIPRSSDAPSSPLRDCIVELEKSHRFDPERGIGKAAEKIKRGDAAGALEVFRAGDPALGLEQIEGRELERALTQAAIDGYAPMLRAGSPDEALARFEQFRLLAAHRRGPRGVVSLNTLAERALCAAGLLPLQAPSSRFYSGRPVLVTENDYREGLFNGDVGVIWSNASGALRAYFSVPGGGVRDISPGRLPPHETVFATSIHKSQGSEFDEIAVVLPDARSPLCTRELIYTALTRARRRARVFGSAESIERGVERRAQRASGLAEALWSPP